jgi:hypothetical protein
MRQLRGEDARFVYAETGHANSNITLVHIYDPSTAPGGRVRFKGFLKHIESRLHLSPIFRQKLLRVPLELDYPYWIEDNVSTSNTVATSPCRNPATGGSSASRHRGSMPGRST